jgi:O-antigen/teichoic acid export membrane protein
MIRLARVGRLFGGAGEQAASQILGNSASLVGSVAMTSGVGFVYWFVAALLFPQAQIGIAAASISAMTLLAALGTFGLGTLLIAEIPRHAGREVGLIATAMVFSGSAGVALGVVFAVGVANVNPEFRPLAASPWIVSLFSLGVGLTAAAAVLDVALLALLRSDLQFARAAVFALVKLGLIVAAGIALVDSEHHVTIIATWIAGLLLSLVTLGVYATAKGHVRRIRPLEFEALRNLRGDAIRNHALNLALALPDWSMPILVTAILSAADSGAFFIAWMMAGVALFIPASLAQSLNAVCARSPELLPTNLRLTLRMSFVAGVVVWLATALVGPFVLGLLGNRYFEAAPALVILALGIFPVTIKVHYVTMGRLEDSLGETTRTATAGAIVELLLAAAGGMLAGLTGVALGVLIGLILQAIAMTPRIRRGLRTGLRIRGIAASTSGPV